MNFTFFFLTLFTNIYTRTLNMELMCVDGNFVYLLTSASATGMIVAILLIRLFFPYLLLFTLLYSIYIYTLFLWLLSILSIGNTIDHTDTHTLTQPCTHAHNLLLSLMWPTIEKNKEILRMYAVLRYTIYVYFVMCMHVQQQQQFDLLSVSLSIYTYNICIARAANIFGILLSASTYHIYIIHIILQYTHMHCTWCFIHYSQHTCKQAHVRKIIQFAVYDIYSKERIGEQCVDVYVCVTESRNVNQLCVLSALCMFSSTLCQFKLTYANEENGRQKQCCPMPSYAVVFDGITYIVLIHLCDG